MNNKGFIVSTILYTILIAFLLFLGVTLSVFASAISTVSGGTDDLVNATYLSVRQVDSCDDEVWYDPSNRILAVITSKYGEYYWPKDFGGKVESGKVIGLKERNNLAVECSLDNGTTYVPCEGLNIANYKDTGVFIIRVKDKTGAEDQITIGNPCL